MLGLLHSYYIICFQSVSVQKKKEKLNRESKKKAYERQIKFI